MPDVRVLRADDRFRTVGDGVETTHSFSYGAHYDPDRIRFGAVMALNVEHVAPGAGYPAHRHSDVEIVTWVLAGALAHADSTGTSGVIEPGVAQRLSAGPGVEHTEANASTTDPLVFVQIMLATDSDGDHDYASAVVDRAPGTLASSVPVLGPAQVFVATLGPGRPVHVPAADRLLVHVTRGRIRIGDAVLEPGDELHAVGGALELASDGVAEALMVAEGNHFATG